MFYNDPNPNPSPRKFSELKNCEDTIIYLKDLRGKIPHNNIVTKELKEADSLLFNQIKFWEDKRNSIIGKK